MELSIADMWALNSGAVGAVPAGVRAVAGDIAGSRARWRVAGTEAHGAHQGPWVCSPCGLSGAAARPLQGQGLPSASPSSALLTMLALLDRTGREA